MGKKSKSKKNLTEIVCVLDRSGSMGSIIDDAIGGFNAFLRSQQELDEGLARMTIAMFDDEYDLITESEDIADVEEFDTTTFVPRGCTALNDAIGKTITTMSENFNNRSKSKKPDNVVFVILTDGGENTSREYKLDQVKKLIEDKTENEDWKFVFLSSDVSAFEQGDALGIRNTTRYGKSGKSTKSAYASLSCAVEGSRKGNVIKMSGEIK